jgi:fibronectin-binding autotransporter adhesin
MKHPSSNLRTTLLNAALVTAITQGSALQAGNLTWDANGITADVTNGAGAWNTTAPNWWDGAANVAWTDGDTAIIGTNPLSGAGGTINFTEAVDISALGLVVNDNANATNHTLAAPLAGSMKFTIGTGGITANDGITIAQKLFMGGNQSWTRSATGNGALIITGEVDDDLVLRNLGISSALGSGTVGIVLRGAVFHDGTTSIDDGWVQARHDAFGTSQITLNGTIGGAQRLQFINAAGTGVGGTLDNPVALGSGKEGNFHIWGGFTTTLSQPITGGDALSVLRKTDGGTLALAADSTYTGLTIVDAGTLRLGTGGTTGAIDSSASLTINGTGILSIQRSGATNLSALLPGNAGDNFAPFTANDGQINFSGPTQSDTLTINQDIGTANTFGQLRVSSGTMILASGADLQLRSLSVGHTTLASGNVGTLNVETGSAVTLATGTLSVLNVGDSSGNAGILNINGGSINLPGTNATSAVRIGHWGGTGSQFNISSGSLSVPAGRINIGWDGEATLNMSGGTITAFAMLIDGNVAGPAATANLTGGLIELGGNGLGTAGSGTLTSNGGKIISLAANTLSVPRTINTGGLTTGFGSLTTNITVTDNSVTTGTGPLTIVNESATGLKNYTINVNSPAYSGAVSVPDGVRLWLQQPNALGTGTATIVSGSGAFLTSSAAPYPVSFDLSGNGWLEPTSSEAFGALRLQTATVAGNVNIAAGGARITAHSGSNGTITGNLTGASALEINSTQPSNNGTITLAGNGSGFTGPISVPQGRLNITGSVGGDVSVVNGATLGGEGTIAGSLTLGAATPITLSINPATPGALAVGGNVTLTGTNPVTFSVPPTSTGAITVLTYSGSLSGDPATNLALANPGNYRSAIWADTGSAITLSLSNKNLAWAGSAGGAWDLGSTASWTDGSPSPFFWGDNVSFPDGAVNTTIAIVGGEVAPASMTFPANSTPYTLTASAGTAQVETATAAGATTADGTVQVTVTASDLPGSSVVIPVAVTTGQAATVWGGTVRAALNANSEITSRFTVGGSNATITLTRRADSGGRFPANDSTLNIALDNGSPTPGITTAFASVDTTGGVLTQRIAGLTSLVKSGSGLLTMGGGNAYTGGTILSKGETRVRSTGALGTGTVTLGDANTGSDNVSLYLDDTARVNFNTPVVISNNGTGTMTLGSRSTASGTGDNNQFTNITLQRNVIFDANAFDRTDFETISGTGNITINGTGRALFMTANTFVGNLTLNNTNILGLQIGTNSTAFNAIPDASNVTINAGSTLALSYTAGGSETIAGLNGAGLVRNNGGNANTLIVGSGNANGSFSGTINNGGAGAFSVTKTGSGTQTLSGVNSAYTGTTTISGGVLEAAALANIGANSSIGAASVTTGNIVFGSPTATLRYIGATNVSTDRGFTLSSGTTGAGATLEASGAGAWTIPAAIALNYGTVNEARTLTIGGTGIAANTYSGTITNNGTAATNVVKSGTGIWALTANNSFTGPLSITGGKLNLSFIGNGGVASQVGQSPKAGTNLLLNGGTLAYTGITAATDRGFATGTTGGGIEIPTSTTLTFGSASAALALGGTLTKTGPGTLNLTTYTGSTATAASDMVINEGVVNFGSSYFNSSPFGYRALAITVNPTGVLRTSTSHALGGDNIDAGTSWGQVRLIGGEWNAIGDHYIAGGTVASEGRLVMQAGLVSGTGQIRSANAAGGSVISVLPAATSSIIECSAGTSVGFAPMTFEVADGAAASDLVVSNVIVGGNGIVKSGSGLMLLSGINTYTGTTTVNAGTLELADNARLRFAIPATGASNKLTGSGTATLKGDFAIDISAAAALTTGTWVLEDAITASYESTFSVVTPAGVAWTDAGGNKWTTPGAVVGTVWTFDEASGTLTLGTADAYGSWELANGIAGAGSGVDSDNDGIPNGIEFVIGGDPSGPGSDSNNLLPIASTTATHLVFVFRRTDDSAAYDPFVEYGSDLTGWTAAEAGVNGVTILDEDDAFGTDIDRVTVTIPRALEVGAKMFARLRVDIP